MSLLMNALKKAEKAKQAGQLEEEVPAVSEANRNLAQELGLDPPASRSLGSIGGNEATVSKSEQLHVTLEPMELALEPESTAPPPPALPEIRTTGRSSARTGSNSTESGRGSARTVFSAKKSIKANSRIPFYSLIGVSLLATAGYGTYLWMQMSPPTRPIAAVASPNLNLNRPPVPTSPSPAPIGEPPAASPVGSEFPAPSQAPAASVRAVIEEDVATGRLNDTTVRREELQTERAMPMSTPPRGSRTPRDVASASGGAAIDSPANLRITRNANIPTVNPDVLAGYAALQAGDLDRAGQSYDRALLGEPANRDALMGAATVLLRLERTDAAEAYFRQLLRLHPNDTYATAQLAALTARGDPVGSLSQVNSLIAREADYPDSSSGSSALAFVQGNQLAAQTRWPEAQQAYFNAHRGDPTNADYCYNLAISLDRIREPRLARDFYRKAIELAKGRVAGFDVARAQIRLNQIDGALK